MANNANPFGGGEGVTDPFSDPSVQSAYGDNYSNPFEQASAGGHKPAAAASASTSMKAQNAGGSYGAAPTGRQAAASVNPKQKSPEPAHGRGGSAFAGMSPDELAIREQALLRREQALAEKEKFLDEKEAALASQQIIRPKNWPFKCYPILYHSINEEIPPEHRPMVRKFYATVLFTWLCIIWNWVVIMTVWGGNYAGASSSDALWSSIFVAIGIPGGWILWYRSIYYGCRDKATGKWVLFFLSFFMHIAFAICMGLGVPSIAASGLFLMFKLFANSDNLPGIFSLVSVGVFALNALFCIYLIKQAHNVWRGAGGDKALKRDVAKAVVAGQMAAGAAAV